MRFKTNVQNICKLQPFNNKLDLITMQKLFLLLMLALFFSCEKNDTNDILPDVYVSETININLPQYIDLQTARGYAYTNGGIRGIVVQNTGMENPPYKAFDRACPNNDCATPMDFIGSFKLKCPCDNSEYSIIDGSPQTSGNNYFAREYRVIVQNESTLNIRNF